MRPYCPRGHIRDGLYLLYRLFLHIEQQHHDPLGFGQTAYSHIEILILKAGTAYNTVVRSLFMHRLKFLPFRPCGLGYMVMPAIVANPEQPCGESCPPLKTSEREIGLEQGLLGDIVRPERIPAAKNSQESSQRSLILFHQLYELCLVHFQKSFRTLFLNIFGGI